MNAATDNTSMAVIMRFNVAGFIDARNGSAYVALSSIPYSAGALYRFRLIVDPQNHTYSAWVTPPSAAEIQVANNYAFRTEQAATSGLNSWTLHSGAGGTHNICNFSLTPGASYSCKAGTGAASGASVGAGLR